MLIPHVAFWVLLIWSLRDDDLDTKEAAILAGIWGVVLAVFFLLKIPMLWFVVPVVLLDVVLIVKIFGGNVRV